MAVAYNTHSVAVRGNGTTVSFSYTCSAGADRLLMVGTVCAGGQTFNSGTYATVALTNVDSISNMKSWRKVGPATGANTLSFSMSAYATMNEVGVSDYTGVDQTTPLGTVSKTTGTSTTPATASMTVPTDGMLWGIEQSAYTTSGTPTAGSGTTLIGALREGAGGTTMAQGRRATTGTISFVIASSTSWKVIGYPINPVAATSQIETISTRTKANVTTHHGIPIANVETVSTISNV